MLPSFAPPSLPDATVLAFRAPAGTGGLGQHAAHVLRAMARLSPELRLRAPKVSVDAPAIDDHRTPPDPLVPAWRRRYTWWRYLTGSYQLEVDRRFGRWLASDLSERPFARGYFFTQIALESLALARRYGAPTLLDCPNGHIRDFREQLCRESEQWTGWTFTGHPSEAMVDRVEAEYARADWIRVSSQWARRSLLRGGLDDRKIIVIPQPIDLSRFAPRVKPAATGPLKLVFVGSISLGKGFQYLLDAMSRIGGRHFSLTMVGATGDPWSRRLLRRLRADLDVTDSPGDPRHAYQSGELFVLPTLHDGFGLVVGEAMACGLPVLTTDACGAAELIQPRVSGWIAPRGDRDAFADALDLALTRRRDLYDMGREARRGVERVNSDRVDALLAHAVAERWVPGAAAVA